MANPLTTLRKLIVDTHNADELRTLCFDLGVKYDALPGEGTPAKSRELILYLGRHRQLARLLAAVGQGRPEAFEAAGLRADPAAVQALEAALPAWEAAELGAEADKLRRAVEAMAEAGLPVAPAQERLAALEARLEQLDVPATYRARVTGSGAVAQGAGAVAAGEGGVAVGRDVGGDVVVGNKSTGVDQRGQRVEHQANVYQAAPGSTVPLDSGLTKGWNVEAIRQMLLAAFNDRELTTLCFDRFRAVYEGLRRGMSKEDKVCHLIDYCLYQDQVDVLLVEVKRRNPAQYNRFAGRLRA
jgi:hypothetical protein